MDFDIGHASYFERRDFLLSQRENIRLKEILYARVKSRDLDFVVNVKSEKELKEIARQLMLIRDRLERCDFSNSERAIVDFILGKKLEIRDMTTKEIAQGAFGGSHPYVLPARPVYYAYLCIGRGAEEV